MRSSKPVGSFRTTATLTCWRWRFGTALPSWIAAGHPCNPLHKKNLRCQRWIKSCDISVTHRSVLTDKPSTRKPLKADVPTALLPPAFSSRIPLSILLTIVFTTGFFLLVKPALAQFSLLPQTDRLIRTTPTSYEDCILKNLRNTASDVAAQAIIEACQAKFKTETSVVSLPKEQPAETTLSKTDLGLLNGKLGWMDGEGVQVWVVNRTERWVLEQVTLGIEYWNPEAAGVVSVQLVSPPLEGAARIPPGYGMWVHFQGVSPHALIHLERWWFEAASGFQRRDTPTLAEQTEQARQKVRKLTIP